jgi:hypothetical protein
MRWTRQCRARTGSQGGSTRSVSDREARKTSGVVADGEVVWSWHPLLVSSLAEVLAARPGARNLINPRGDGDKKELVAEESAKETVKTTAQGRPVVPPSPVVTTVCYLFCTRAMGAASIRPSLRPRCVEGHECSISSGAWRRERGCMSPSFPGEALASNPDSRDSGCFAPRNDGQKQRAIPPIVIARDGGRPSTPRRQ